MTVLIGIALKSLLIAGLTLGLLALMKQRSAAERSWVAHIGLLALIIMAFAPLVLPSWNVEAPALFGNAPTAEAAVPDSPPLTTVASAPRSIKSLPELAAAAKPSLSTAAAATALYAVPAAILLFITFLALARLIALRARAEVLVDSHWLSALARAQRRMGFKHGTALLTSNELSSPISWGLMRPVILLSERAVEASGEAEAIIAHELAHVARMDWIKLLLARVATALFWFNPFVWLLAREAHQLREEAADDAVLGADIVDTDYAQLLVGVARHECPGLLLGAHGVAPSKSSLARRVARVLDGKSVRGPVARSFAAGVFVGAVLIAAPLAALTLTPGGPKLVRTGGSSTNPAAIAASKPYYASNDVPADLPHIIADGVSTSVQTAVAAVVPQANRAGDFESVAPSGASVRQTNGVTVARSPSGATVTVYPADSKGLKRVVARAPDGATTVTYVDEGDGGDGVSKVRIERRRTPQSTIDQIIEMKSVGVTPELVAAVRSGSPALRNADLDDIVIMQAVGVTPQYIRDRAAAGLDADADARTHARAVGLEPSYVRGMAAAGFRGEVDDYVQMRAVGVTPEYAAQFRRAGYKVTGTEQLVKMKVRGVTAESLRSVSQTPKPPRPPRTPPDPDDPDGG
jgi:bla regulator protein BlaR1